MNAKPAALTPVIEIPYEEVCGRMFRAKYPGVCALTGYQFLAGTSVRVSPRGGYISVDACTKLGFASTSRGTVASKYAPRHTVDVDKLLATAQRIVIVATGSGMSTWERSSDGRWWSKSVAYKTSSQLRTMMDRAFALAAE